MSSKYKTSCGKRYKNHLYRSFRRIRTNPKTKKTYKKRRFIKVEEYGDARVNFFKKHPECKNFEKGISRSRKRKVKKSHKSKVKRSRK